ncbi:MAG: endonuclease [Elusimicrobia bacterium]|nr:endonuclease [Elusimicrobiota bacterium]
MKRTTAGLLAALLLVPSLRAQNVRVTGSFVPTAAAPIVTGLGSPVAISPFAMSPLSAAPSLVPALAAPALSPAFALQAAITPVPVGAPAAALAAAPVPAAAKSELPSGAPDGALTPVKAATPVDGWAKRFNFQPSGQVFDGSRAIKDEAGATFQAVPKGQGAVRVHLVERAPLAAQKPVQGTEGLTGKALLDALNQISGKGHKERSYSEASDYMFAKADHVIINGVSGVVDAYSGIFVPGTSKEGGDYPERGDSNGDGYSDGQGMNVEHTWPQSLFNKALPMRSDLHHLMATFMHPNSVRGHMPFGVVTGNADYENKAGAKRGNGVFEPPDAVKGRVARGLLYFYSRYKDSRMFGRTSVVFWNQQVELMMKWNRQFPPDAFEARRNDLVEQWQGNRNPFIDDYTLADRVGADAFRAGNGPSRGADAVSFKPSGRSSSSRRHSGRGYSRR